MGSDLELQTVPRIPYGNGLCQRDWMLAWGLSGSKSGEQLLAAPGDLGRSWCRDVL